MKREYCNTEDVGNNAIRMAEKKTYFDGNVKYAKEESIAEGVSIEEADTAYIQPSLDDIAEAGTLTPEDAGIVSSLAPKPKQDYAVAGAGMYADIAGHTPAVLTEEGKRSFTKYIEKVANKAEGKSVLFGLNDKGEVYNTLTAYEKAFIIALRVLLSDSTKDRHALIEGMRKAKGKEFTGNITAYEGIDFFGACSIRPEAYDIHLQGEKSRYYDTPELHPNPKEAALMRLGFTPTDITVVIDKNTFIRDYLGGKKGGTQSQAFTDALTRLRTGRVAFVNSTTKGGGTLITDSLIRRTASFFGDKKGQKVEYHAISLHPIFARIFTPNYITYPANNAEVLGAILNVRRGAEGLLSLYDLLLQHAARNFGAIEARPGVQAFTLKEAEILPLLTTEAQIKKNRKDAVARLYSDTGINLFYTVGLLADRVAPPTGKARKEAAATGKDVEVEVHYRRVAATNCTA